MTSQPEPAQSATRQAAIRRLFEARGRSGGDARSASAELDATGQEIEARLSRLMGSRGVEALFGRALHLAGRRFECLAPPDGSAGSAENPATFATVAARLTAVEPALAAEASLALLLAFTDLLAALIGDSLTDLLLGPVWASGATPPAATPPAANDEETP